MDQEYEKKMENDKNLDKDIKESRGELINSLRQQPDYLLLKYNEKLEQEKAKKALKASKTV